MRLHATPLGSLALSVGVHSITISLSLHTQDLPKAEALESNNLLKEEERATNEKIDELAAEAEQSEDEANENDLSEDAEKVHIRMPMELDLSDLAGALLMNHNQQ